MSKEARIKQEKFGNFEKKAEISKKKSKEARNKQKIFQICEKLRK